MKIEIDTHTHTIASGHAYSTMSEMITSAKRKNLKALGITEHAPAMPGTCQSFYFHNFRVIPREKDGIKIFMGAELNIIDYFGKVDLDDYSLSCIDYAIASMHMPCIKPGNIEENTCAIINAMKNPFIKIIGHPDDSRFPLDYEKIVKSARENHVLLELNNSSLNPSGFRQNAKTNDKIMLNLCKQYNVPIVLGSDAHIEYDVGNFIFADSLIKEIDFPNELIINTSLDKFEKFLRQ